ncbi:MAG: DNA mismatch repair endonuclease MutL [Calditrichaeota bacterium]|nr:MAG: DNA mismatch repair endonuclease MutL [Calditrichota bacterium]
MKHRIQVLPPHIANKIAAGEVVDRPASVVKELVENALDARAQEITVVIGQAGKELIQVIDNGVGIPGEEAPLAFQRHATSKIASAEDLDRIATLGFRGEALPSIASVARVELKTRTAEEPVGTLLRLEGGKITVQERVALNPGTTVTVKNLFYNTPARRNFLRADTTEFNHILKVMRRFFLAYPEVHFVLVHNGEELYNLPAGSREDRIVQVFGEKFFEGLVPVREELNQIVLEGYISRPEHTRGNSEHQYIYLNRRTILSRNLSHAVFQAYGNRIERGRYPQYVLFLSLPPNLVDVNVHPTKMEVRFANERAIYHLFLSAARRVVQTDQSVPEFTLKQPAVNRNEIQQHFQTMRRLRGRRGAAFASQNRKQLQFSLVVPPESQDQPEAADPAPHSGEESAPQVQANLWQVHNRYILSQVKSGLVIIDQHVAHERILYEKMLRYLQEERNVPSQQLLFPQTLELSLEDYLIYDEIKDWLKRIGFSITELSGRTLLIEAIPMDVKVGYEGKILLDILDYYRENQGSTQSHHEKIAAAFACKNAIKSGEKLNLETMNALVDQLFACREPFFCPHGRPVLVNLPLEELDKKFKRI